MVLQTLGLDPAEIGLERAGVEIHDADVTVEFCVAGEPVVGYDEYIVVATGGIGGGVKVEAAGTTDNIGGRRREGGGVGVGLLGEGGAIGGEDLPFKKRRA